jgi:Uma2 family endonuclease
MISDNSFISTLLANAMLPVSTPLPISAIVGGVHRFTVDEYHRLIQMGILTEDTPVELLEGYLVATMPRNPPHDSTIQKLNRIFARSVPEGWEYRCQCAITIDESEPEPDFAVVLDHDYSTSHPAPNEIALVVEVSAPSLLTDQTDKQRIYAAGIPVYWLINLPDQQVEVYSSPDTSASPPVYRQRNIIPNTGQLEIILDGNLIASIPVADLLPS